MSATSFLRHRRAAAVKFILQHLEGPREETVIAVLAGYQLKPGDVRNLEGNNDVLSIVDEIAKQILDEPELDSLETLNQVTIGERAAVHGVGVRSHQFEPLIQHPAAETVGVGNMHDIPSMAAEDIANVSQNEVDDAGSLFEAARLKADDPLFNHGNLPPVAPTSAPAGDQSPPTPGAEGGDEAAATAPTDPNGDNAGAETVVDIEQAVEDLGERREGNEQLEKLGEDALASYDRQQLLDYAERHRLTLADIGERTQARTILKQILAIQQKGNE